MVPSNKRSNRSRGGRGCFLPSPQSVQPSFLLHLTGEETTSQSLNDAQTLPSASRRHTHQSQMSWKAAKMPEPELLISPWRRRRGKGWATPACVEPLVPMVAQWLPTGMGHCLAAGWALPTVGSINLLLQAQQHQQQRSKTPPPSWSCGPCPSAPRPSWLCPPSVTFRRRHLVDPPRTPASRSCRGAAAAAGPSWRPRQVTRWPVCTAPALPRQGSSCRWAVNCLPAGDLNLPPDQRLRMAFKGKARLCQRIWVPSFMVRGATASHPALPPSSTLLKSGLKVTACQPAVPKGVSSNFLSFAHLEGARDLRAVSLWFPCFLS